MELSPFPTNRTFTRWWTARALARALAELGDEHPDTLAAHAAAVEAWGADRIRCRLTASGGIPEEKLRQEDRGGDPSGRIVPVEQPSAEGMASVAPVGPLMTDASGQRVGQPVASIADIMARVGARVVGS